MDWELTSLKAKYRSVKVYDRMVLVRGLKAVKACPRGDFAPKRVIRKGGSRRGGVVGILARAWDRKWVIVVVVLELWILGLYLIVAGTNAEIKDPVTSLDLSPIRFTEYELQEFKAKVSPKKAEAAVLPKGEVQELIVKYFGKDSAAALKVAKCESGLNPKAANKVSSARGVFQIIKGTWVSNRKAMGLSTDLDLRFDAEENIKTAKYLYDRRGWQPWVCKP